ncbi:MAG: putative Fe-S cluster assembly protein SufT [Planctomycetota bacterium]
MIERESIELTRDVNAIVIPDGSPTSLTKGSKVTLQQSLGGTYTVSTEFGFLARIAGEDADALGKEVEAVQESDAPVDQSTVDQAVWAALATCYDPEIPVNIVELGLVYECKVVESEARPGTFQVEVRMTLTAPGCGMGPVLQGDAATKIRNLPGVSGVNVELVFDPPWQQQMMSEAARLQLGMI